IGPWHHGQEIEDGSSLGAIDFEANSSLYFQRNILGPFLAHYLKDGAPPMDVAPVSAYETGTNRWERLPSWPAGCDAGCTIHPTPLYLGAGLTAGFDAPAAAAPGAAFDAYVSDPAKPVPFRARPSRSDTLRRSPGCSGWWTTSARRAAAPTCCRTRPLS